MVAVIIALTGWAIFEERADARRAAVLASANVAQILADNFTSSVRQIDLGLLAIIDEMARQKRSARIDAAALAATIDRQNSRLRETLGFRIFGADGALQAGSANLAQPYGNIAQRNYFMAHRDNADSGLLVGPAEFGLTTHTWRVSVSRRISNPNGSFAGVVICSIPTKVLSENFAKVDMGSKGEVLLAHADAGLAARFPEVERSDELSFDGKLDPRFLEIIRSGARIAQYEYRSPVDAVDRLATVRWVEGFPYYLLVGVAEEDYLAKWRRNTLWLLLFASLMSAAVVAGAMNIHRRISNAGIADAALRANEFRWKSALEGAGAGVWDWDVPSGEIRYSAGWREMLGYDEEDILPGRAQSQALIHPDDHTRVAAAVREHLAGKTPRFLAELRLRCKDGQYRWILSRGMIINHGADGKPLRMIGTSTDISARKRDEEQLRLSENVFTHAQEAIVLCDVDSGTTVIDVNPAFTRITGYLREEVIGRRVSELEAFRYAQDVFEATQRALLAVGYWSGEKTHYRKNGDSYPVFLRVSAVRDDTGAANQFVAFFSDISQQKEQQRQLEQAAYCDTLTGLPNRRLLRDRLTLALAGNKRNGLHGALLLLDLDNFKPLNDEHGHALGDLLLIEVARRLGASVREVDTVARLGGDEFVVVLTGLNADAALCRREAQLVAEKIRSLLAETYVLPLSEDGGEASFVEHHCTASIGVTLFKHPDSYPDEILQRADKAMYAAKESGRNAIGFYPETAVPATTTDELAGKLIHLNWSPDYECGNRLIDDQHRALVAAANRLLTNILTGHQETQLAAQIDALMQDLVQHFKDEEAIFTAAGFPDSDGHKAIHRQLVEEAVAIVEHFHSGQLDVGEMFKFLAQNVVTQHILSADRAFFPYVR
ncbi:bacteriohemerythrin [Rhodocyclus tenuis]|uniref:Diguanylate cyclase (GGDEF)-like protein/hemerythrin-like metal-binding protein/PAS domain S-box-containing protein n=1 Tax=Rhodocyclus tenuis TaxID=1066 RepID=A0A840G509_RHOTE|nr:bacteriohemerythrin [Rhodocyclus tenuis]MBB4247016.1 diguanylate cyclase (GGDEF)-like protein/hemerythrin-like metal-binding protein/PAS domain S-box-containing protein [Rhodocyclus tenuis]